MMLAIPQLEPLMHLTLHLGPLSSIGEGPTGEGRMARVAGGYFHGPRLRGDVEPGCVDWQLARRDGVLEIDARYVLLESSGAVIKATNQGLRHGPKEVLAALAFGETVDPARYFFRSFMRFETGSREFSWLNQQLAVCSGARQGNDVEFAVAVVR